MNLMNYATLRLKCGEEHWNLPISGGDCPHHSYFMAAGNMKQPELRSGWATRWNNQYCKPTRAHNPTVVDRTWQTQVFWTTSQPHDVPGSTKLRDPVNPMAVGLFHVFSPCVWDEIKQTINRIKNKDQQGVLLPSLASKSKCDGMCLKIAHFQNPLSSPNYAYLKSNCGAWQSDTTGKNLESPWLLRYSPGPSWKLLTSFTLTATQVANMKMKKHLNKPGMHADICSPTEAMQNNAWKPKKSSEVRYGGSLSCTYLLPSISTFKKVPRHAWWVAIIHSRSKHRMNKTGWASIKC